jgi:hypothetical protein
MTSRALLSICFGLFVAACTAESQPEPESKETLADPPRPPSKETSGGISIKEIDSCMSYTENGGYSAVFVCFYSDGGVCTTRNEYINKKWSGWSDYDCYGGQ